MGRSGRRGRPEGGWTEELLSDKRWRKAQRQYLADFPISPGHRRLPSQLRTPSTANEREGMR